MKKLALSLIALFMAATAMADDARNIALSAHVSDNSGVPKASASVLENKLRTIVTQSGFGASAGNRFILTAKVTPVSEDVTPTAPPMYVYTLNFDFYIGDGVAGTLFATTQVQGKGTGKSKDQAYLMALKSVNAKSPEMKAFIEEGRAKVIEYYEINSPTILNKAKNLAGQQKYEEAARELLAIPEACTKFYDQANVLLADIYQKKIDEEGQKSLAAARHEWSSGQDRDAADRAGKHLAQINPQSSAYKDAHAFQKEIAKRIQALDAREWNFQMQQYKDNVAMQKQAMANETALEKERIRAVRDVAAAYASAPTYVYHYSWW